MINNKRHVVRISPPQSHPPGQTFGSPCSPQTPDPYAYKIGLTCAVVHERRFDFHSYIKLWIGEDPPGGKKSYFVAPPPQSPFHPREETPEIIL